MTKLVELNVTSNQLTTLPMLPETVVRVLAGKNHLNTLSPNFDALANLELCDLSDNDLEGLGEAFTSGAHVKLATLDLRRNKLESLPPSVVALPGLEKLEIEGNPLGVDIIKAAAEGAAALKLAFGAGAPGNRTGEEVSQPHRLPS